MRLVLLSVILAACAAAADLGPELLAAAKKGQTPEVAALLTRGAPVDSADKDGRTALMLAAQRGHADTVKLLLTRGAKPDARDRDGWSAYALAVAGGRDAVVKVLPAHEPIPLGIDVTWAPDNLYSSCLMTPQQLASVVAALSPDRMVDTALETYRDQSGKGVVAPVVHDAKLLLTLKVRPGVSCLQQQAADNLTLAIDAKLVRMQDQAVLLEKTFGGGLKGLHAQAVTGAAQYGPVFSQWAKSHASEIYWAAVEACLRAR
jgi:hypothetical protein